EGVEWIDRLLFVFREMLARGIERECTRERDAGRVFGINAGALTERRDRRADDSFRKSLLIDVRDVKNLETTGPVCGVKIFAAKPNVLNVVTAVFVRFSENRTVIEMLFVIGGIRDRLQMTPDDGLRFVRLSPDHGMQSF